LRMGVPPCETETVNAVLFVGGTAEKMNKEPPLIDDNAIDAVPVLETVKSDGTPVVAPAVPITTIVQIIGTLARWGEPDMQDNDDAVVGFP